MEVSMGVRKGSMTFEELWENVAEQSLTSFGGTFIYV
jgi:hypothetical protein